MKKVLSIILSIMIVFTISVPTYAEENVGFDASYYAAKYPDVVEALGTDYNALYNHYVTFGIKEGRYQNQYEEDNKIVNSSNIDVNNPPIVTPTISPIPGYSTYIDVSIEYQTVTYFEDGDVKLQSPCVTGLANGKRDTPKGTFTILTKVPGKRLKGKTWDCWVNRWMKFTIDSCGLHDASWRSKFGGDIYKTNGSHGCVNLPKDVAYELYDLVSVGTTVIVH